MSNQSFCETLITAQSDGAAVTAAAATTLLPAHALFTLPPNFWQRLGQKIQIKATGRISSLITTPGTARFDVRFGATVVFDGLAILLDTVAGHTNVHWELDIELSCRAVGATANLMGFGKWTSEDILGVPATAPKGCLVATLPWNTAPVVGANFNSGVSQQVDLFFTQTAATGSITLHTYELIAKN